MIWSISSFRSFLRCQRKWFYKEKVASRSNKVPFKRQVYLLSQLESIDAWRGKIVDYTISEFIIPQINRKQIINNSEVYNFARKLAEARYKFAMSNQYKEENLKKTEHSFDYTALYTFEFPNKKENQNDKFKKAWEEINTSLNNFQNNEKLLKYLYSSKYLIKQRNLKYKVHDFTIQCVPDLIVFFSDKPPHIFDWKVHYYGTKTYTEQLMIYALALKNCKAHKDFPDITMYSVEDFRLTEYQLLKNTLRHYTLIDYVEEINDFIADGIYTMKMKSCDADYEDLNINDFEKTKNLDACKICSFKKICMED